MRPRTIWLCFAAGAVVASVIVGVLSYKLVAYEGRHRQGLADREHQRRVELALWRLDSLVGPVLAAENTRPYFHYRGSFPAENPHRLYGIGGAVGKDDEMLKSPLSVSRQPYVVSYFEIGPQAQSFCVAPGGQVSATTAPTASREMLIDCAPPAHTRNVAANWGMVESKGDQPQVAREWQIRALSQQRQAVAMKMSSAVQTESIRIAEGVMAPVWDGERLLNVRQLSVNGAIWIQGAELDWVALKGWLEGNIRDLLPNGRLVPANLQENGMGAANRLAGLPIDLIPGPSVVVLPSAFQNTIGWFVLVLDWCPVLLVLWSCFIILLVGGAILLRAMIGLDERRAAFVSAVTHELRTPLTTFRMYVEMQRAGMVTDPKRIAEHMEVLDQESGRLVHLVENVLAYAQLDQGRASARLRDCTVGEVMDEALRQIEPHVDRQDATVAVELSETDAGIGLHTDASAISQILFNLVDNACKYGRTGDETMIRMFVRRSGQEVEIEVRDYGEGVPTGFSRRLFQPFSRAGDAASGDAPGVGLGLALCHRLAHSLGGELVFQPPEAGGAAFTLRLPTSN